ncbi:MAG: hypothetical protein ABIQ40_00500 [Bacteroidia bacterium]
MIGRENNYEASYSSGISRDTRIPVALLPENIPLDERGLEDDLYFAGSLSNYINFYNSKNQAEGTWHPFFGKSEPALLATIATTNLEKIKKEFDDFVMLFDITKRQERKIEELDHIFDATVAIALRINHWQKHLSRSEKSSVLLEINSLIEGQLRTGLAKLQYIDRQTEKAVSAAIGHPFNGDYSMFGEKWRQDIPEKIDIEITDVNVFVVLYSVIQGVFNEFFHALSQIVKNTQKNIEKIISEKSDNRPDISLYIAFASLMKTVRLQMNSITERHLDFYYFDVLRHQRLPFTPDQALVRFVLQDNASEYFLPAGTELVAGKDETGKELIYTTDTNISINQGKIAALHTLFVSRNEEVITGVQDESAGIVKAIYSSANPAATLNGVGLEWWPLMGNDQVDNSSSQQTMKEADLGFSITSAALFLNEGQRDVTVTFSLDETSATLKTLRRIIAEVAHTTARNQTGTIFYLLSKALSITITSAEGWKNIERYAFNYDDKNTALILRFSFTPADPGIIGFDPVLHGEGFDTQWPVLRMMLNTHNAPVYAYSLLCDVLVNRIRIHTSVKGIRKLVLYNNAGKLSVDKPFQPFGALPLPGSYLLIGSSEALNKNIQSMQLHLLWSDLPPDGFGEYYKGYPGEITNASFTAGISLLQKGYFLPLRDSQQQVQLFHDASTDHPDRGIPVMQETIIDKINMKELRQRPSWNTPDPLLTYGSETQDGFLKLELLTPPLGFGSAEYAPLLSSTMVKNSKTKKPQPLPRLPYTPVLSAVSLDYTAEFDSDNSPPTQHGELPVGIYRHHPFGMERVAIASSFRNIALFPKYNSEGYLFIGLTGLALPQPLSILFRLSDESFYSHEAPGEVEWSFLSNNNWKLFRKDRVLCDGTNKFVQPGIIDLDLPSDITNNNTIMPSGLYWICASVKEKTHCISYAKALDTQAVSATWKYAGNSFAHLDEPLPAGSIKKTKEKIQPIKEVIQSIASKGGRIPEEKHEAYARLSERLGHRNRALLPVDFERMVLQQFPTVYKVQCFPDMNGAGKHKRGNILIVVMPDIDRRNDINAFRPKDSYSLLQNITDFLKEHASPFAKIEVRNPLYERVKVIANIKFKRGLDSGFHLRKLNQDMRTFLSPWIYDSMIEVKLGGFISRSDVLGFIERQTYVDFVTALSVVVTKDHDGFFLLDDTARMKKDEHDGEDIGTLHAGKPWSVLVTASRHLFTAIDEEKMEAPIARGIENLVIGDDFIITQ